MGIMVLGAGLALSGCGDDDEGGSTVNDMGMVSADMGGGGGGSGGCTGFCRPLSRECAEELGVPFMEGFFDGCIAACEVGVGAIGAACSSAVDTAGACIEGVGSCADIGMACQAEIDAADEACRTDET